MGLDLGESVILLFASLLLTKFSCSIHHAGMLRSDRTLSERMFEANVTKVSSILILSLQKLIFRTRFSAVLLLSLGESIYPPTPSSSRVRRSTIAGKECSSILEFSTFCRFSVELVR